VSLVRSFLVLALLVVLPGAAAQECSLDQKAICDPAKDAGLVDLFGEYGDVALLFLALFVAIALIAGLVWLLGPKQTPKFLVQPRELVREVGPGGHVQLVLDVENRRKGSSLDLWVDIPSLPPGWSAAPYAAVVTPSGWTLPVALGADAPLHLSSVSRGQHKAAVAVQLEAPNEALAEETIDVPIRVTPLAMGAPRGKKATELRYSVLLTTRRPQLQITNVAHDPDRIVAGKGVHTRAVVSNVGDIEAREVGVQFLLNDTAIDRKVVALLPPKAESTVEFDWTPGPGENRIRISVA
jgi:hypothetical protein